MGAWLDMVKSLYLYALYKLFTCECKRKKGGYSQPSTSPSSLSSTMTIVVGEKGTGLPDKTKGGRGGALAKQDAK